MPRYAEHDLQRLLVRAGTRDAAGGDRQKPGIPSPGRVRLKLYKGSATLVGPREPLLSLRSRACHLRGRRGRLMTTGDAEGFIKLNALRLAYAGQARGAGRRTIARSGAPRKDGTRSAISTPRFAHTYAILLTGNLRSAPCGNHSGFGWRRRWSR